MQTMLDPYFTQRGKVALYGNCMKIFMEPLDVPSDFISDKPEIKLLLTDDSIAFITY